MTWIDERSPDAFVLRVEAVASPGLLARCAAVLNPHPVIALSFAELPGGAVTLTVRVADGEHAAWHLHRVGARLQRIVGVTAVEPACAEDGARRVRPDRSPPHDSGPGVGSLPS